MAKPKSIYLDHAAATPVDPEVLKAMEPYYVDQFYNPSATYSRGREVKKALESARAKLAHWMGARPSEIIFTAGGSEANNLAVRGLMAKYPKGNIVVSAIEHESVLEPAMGYDRRIVSVQADGRLDLIDLRRKIDKNTVLLSIMYANNEIGTVQPTRDVAKIVAEVRRGRSGALPIYLHSDAAQAANYLDLHISRLGVDLLTINGGKIYGPKQTGALYVKAGIELESLVKGGGQERGLRSGTESVAGAAGLAKALDIAQGSKQQEGARLQALQRDFIKQIETKLPAAVINGSQRWRLPNNVHVTIPGTDNERVLLELEQQDILAAAGSACNASNELPSHVLSALGLSDEMARASLRFTMGRQTTKSMVDKTVGALCKIVSK